MEDHEKHNLCKRRLFINGEITETIANSFVEKMLYLMDTDSVGSSITIHINSSGGCVVSMFIMHDIIQLAKKTCIVETIASGAAMSAASFLLCCGSKGHRRISSYCTFMVHQPIGAHSWMKQSDEKRWQSYWDKLYTKELNLYSKYTGLGQTRLRKMFHDDTPMFAEDAVRLGFADKVI